MTSFFKRLCLIFQNLSLPYCHKTTQGFLIMAKAPEGILGPFSGRAGNVVGYLLNGQAIFRARPKKPKKPRKPTLLESNNRSKMKLLTTFLCAMPNFLKLTFTPESRGTLYNWYNLAVKYNNPQAIKGTFPKLEIDYPKVILSRGQLKQPVNARAERTKDGVKFSWDVMKGDEYSSDHVMVLLYFPHNHSAEGSMGNVRRHIGTETVPIAVEDLKQGFEAYICFVSYDRQEFSDSLHIASVDPLAEDEQIAGQHIDVAPVKAALSPEEISRYKALQVARNLKKLGLLSDTDIANATGLMFEEVINMDMV